MKNLLIVPAMPYFVPYIRTYTDVMNEQGIEYEIACWNRKGDVVDVPDNYMVFNHPTKDTYSFCRKLIENYKFYRHVRNCIEGKQYKCVFVFTIITGLFFESYLSEKCSGKYVFDIRDYSPALRFPFFVNKLRRLLHNSFCNIISSDGFRDWLPKDAEYLTTHNVRIEDIFAYDKDYAPSADIRKLTILNIGSIRDFVSNSSLIEKLGNKDNVELMFVGDGSAVSQLKVFARERNIMNISFHGRYNKEDENNWVRKADFINSYLPHTMVGDYLMSNRFYLSVMLRRPLIVNEGCFQAKMVEKYGLGVVIYPQDDMCEKICHYWNSIDWNAYNDNCRKFIKVVVEELRAHRKMITSIM